MNFHDTRLDESEDMSLDGGGAVETFTSEDYAKRWSYAATALEKAFGSVTAPGYVYRDGKRVQRLSSGLTPANAKEYEAALSNLQGAP